MKFTLLAIVSALAMGSIAAPMTTRIGIIAPSEDLKVRLAVEPELKFLETRATGLDIWKSKFLNAPSAPETDSLEARATGLDEWKSRFLNSPSAPESDLLKVRVVEDAMDLL